MNFWKRHIGDYIRDTAHLSLLEHGVYARLLDVYYSRECGIPEAEVYRLVGARSREEKAAVDSVLREFFEVDGGNWIQSRCEREISEAKAKAARNREVGKMGGRPKAKPKQDGSNQKPRKNPDGFLFEPTNNPSQTPDSRLEEKDSPPLSRQASVWDLWTSIAGESKRGVLGKLIRDHGEDRALLAVSKLSLLREKVDPVAYVTKMLTDSAGESAARRLAV